MTTERQKTTLPCRDLVNVEEMSDEQNFSITSADTKCPEVSQQTRFQDELHRTVATGVAKESTVEEIYFRDFDDYELMKGFSSTKKTAESGKAGKKNQTVNNFTFSNDDKKPKRVSFMKNRRKDYAELDGSFNTTEKPVEDRHKNGHWSPPPFPKSIRSDRWDDDDSRGKKKMPVPQPREHRMSRVPSMGEETKSSLLDESPKPKPRQYILKKQNVQENELEKQQEKSYNRLSASYSKLYSAVNEHTLLEPKMHSRSPSPEYPRPTSYLSKASSLIISRSVPSLTNDRSADSIQARVKSPTKAATGRARWQLDLTDSGTNSKSSEKKSSTKELIKDNNGGNTIDEMNTKKTEQFSQEEADGDSWESSSLKSNQCMVQCATDHAIREHLQKNSLKPKEKDQSNMVRNGSNSQKTESSRKSISNRPLSSAIQTLDRPSVGKSPRPRTAEPRYLGTLKILDTKSSGNATFNPETADTIRASVYQVIDASVRNIAHLIIIYTKSNSEEVWLEKKKQILHEEQNKQILKEQQENERREQEKIESKKEAKASFEAWKARKNDMLKETFCKKKEEEKKKQQAEAENEQRKEVAKKAAFEKWKEEKEMRLTEILKKQKQIEKEKKSKEKEQVTEKKEENVAAFVKWNAKKEVALKQKMKENAKEKQKKKTEEEYMKYEREEMASTTYEKWLEEKEKQKKCEKEQRKIRSIFQHDVPLPPWSPPNKTIPFGK
ncbi:microtubule-associated protein 9 [Heterodontus francisci]|uniref:microtubule-associated protein 9 n=1 Tax=Heterodontus francisci TaxID=7792 RepID=UPI00355AD31C